MGDKSIKGRSPLLKGGRVNKADGNIVKKRWFDKEKYQKESAKRKEAREVRDVKGNIISREGRPHSTYEGRGSERRRGYLRKNKMLPGQANEKKRIQIKERDPYKKVREILKDPAGFKPLREKK